VLSVGVRSRIEPRWNLSGVRGTPAASGSPAGSGNRRDDRRYDVAMRRLRRCKESVVSNRARIVVTQRVRRDDRTFRHWRTVRAIAAISYRFLARAALLKRQMPLSIE